MKKIILPFIFCLFTTTIKAQGGKAIYIKSLSKKINAKKNAKINKNKYLDFVNKINSNLENVKYSLIFNNIESVFFVQNRMNIDNNSFLRLSVNLGGGRGVFYNNLMKNEILHQADAFGEKFIITSNMNLNKWTLTKESKLINGYLCYKANFKDPNSKKKAVAWYSPEIPFSFGPLNFAGLPGMIVELKLDNNFSFKLVKIYLNKKNKKIKKPTKGKYITKEKFDTLMKEFVKKRKF